MKKGYTVRQHRVTLDGSHGANREPPKHPETKMLKRGKVTVLQERDLQPNTASPGWGVLGHRGGRAQP